jgi:hypothetical protein
MVAVDVLHTGGRYPELVLEYLRSFEGAAVAAYQVPGYLPLIIDDVEEVLPAEAGRSDVAIALGVHPDILAGLPELMACRGGRALVGGLENPGWVPPGLLTQVAQACQQRGIECAFPKPLCALEPHTPVLKQFGEDFRIGRPVFRLVVHEGVIVEAECLLGSPCGLTQWVAEQLVGTPADETIVQRVKVLHHTKPCLASMALDPVLGETVMHLSVDLVEYAAAQALRHAEER